MWRYLELVDTEPLPDEVLERKEMAKTVRDALDKLNKKEQQSSKKVCV